jgi:CDP-glycerol glycerophosphotransferase (TagB/SpsB family)
MISDFSSVGIEFLTLDKPIVFADHLNDMYSDPKLAEIYVREAGYVVRENSKFRKVIQYSLKNPDEKKTVRQKFAKYFFGPMDGRAAERGAKA